MKIYILAKFIMLFFDKYKIDFGLQGCYNVYERIFPITSDIDDDKPLD